MERNCNAHAVYIQSSSVLPDPVSDGHFIPTASPDLVEALGLCRSQCTVPRYWGRYCSWARCWSCSGQSMRPFDGWCRMNRTGPQGPPASCWCPHSRMSVAVNSNEGLAVCIGSCLAWHSWAASLLQDLFLIFVLGFYSIHNILHSVRAGASYFNKAYQK